MAETVPCSLFPVPCPHEQLFQQTLFSEFRIFIYPHVQALKDTMAQIHLIAKYSIPRQKLQ